MKLQSREDFVALFEAIANYFPDWKLAIEPHCNAATFTRADGAAFVLLHNRAMSPQSLIVSGTYPQMYTSTLVKKPEIKISYRRPPEAIAQHITRRFLGDYLHLFELCVTVKHYEQKELEQSKQRFALLAAVFADCRDLVLREQPDKAFLSLPATSSHFKMDLEACYSSETVDLTLNWLPMAITKPLLTHIRELMTSTA
jgi:hypothetical protein